MRAKSAIAGKSHDPKCMLIGEKRWGGKSLGITLEQLQYLADRSLYYELLEEKCEEVIRAHGCTEDSGEGVAGVDAGLAYLQAALALPI